MPEQPPGDRRTVTTNPGLIEAIRIDLIRLHESWMEIVYPRQRDTKHTVLGKWKPSSLTGRASYNAWALLGILVLTVIYPLAVLGFATRFYTRRLNQSAARIGVIGVLLVSIIVWGSLTIVSRYRLSYEGFIAVAAAGAVATISALLSVFFTRIDGRFTTVVFGYPFGVTALFLPPVVAALYDPFLADVIFPRSDVLAIWILDNILIIGGVNDFLRSQFDLVGLAYVGMWFGIAVPIGWFLGLIVSLANVVRPRND